MGDRTRVDQVRHLAERLRDLLNDAEDSSVSICYADVGGLNEYQLHPDELDWDNNDEDVIVSYGDNETRWTVRDDG